MKPKYYSCFFLSLFACDQGKIEVNNEKAQDVDPKGNLLNVDSSIIDVVNNLCEGVKDINDKNDPSAYVELTTKLVGKYANSFCSLERCQGIFKQLCEQVPSYPSQIVYDVLYALVKNKCLGAAGVRTIIQGIKEKNPKVFSSLKTSAEKKFKTCNQGTDDSARIIAESFGFIVNNTIFIPGINTFTSTPLPPKENAITVNDLTDIWQCVSFIKNNGFDTNSLTKLIELASKGDFNKAIKDIHDAGIFFNDSGDEMMNAFKGQYVNLNNEGLKTLAACIQNNYTYDYRITNVDSLKHLFPSVRNCTTLRDIFKECKKLGEVDADFLSELATQCPDNYNDLIESIPPEHFNRVTTPKKDGYLEFLQKNKVEGRLSPLFRKLPKFFKEDDFIRLLETIDLDSAKSLDPLVSSLKKDGKFNLACLQKLIAKYKDESDNFNKVLSKISKEKFYKTEQGDKVIAAFEKKNIKLEDKNLENILSMIAAGNKISDCEKAIDFCCENIKNLNEKNIKIVFDKVEDNIFDLNNLEILWKKGQDKFDKILPYIPDKKLKQDKGNDVIDKIINKEIKLNKNTLPKVLSMIDNKDKISKKNNNKVFQLCYESALETEDIKNILDKCKNFKFNLDCLETYKHTHYKQFNNVLAAIPDAKFVTNCNGNDVVNKIKENAIGFTEGNLSKVLLLCEKGTEKITDVAGLYFVFCRSKDDPDSVNALTKRVGNLDGQLVWDLWEKNGGQEFFMKFCPYIENNSIKMFSSVDACKKFIKVAYEFHKANRLGDLKQKFDYDKFKRPLGSKTISLKKLLDQNDDDFKQALYMTLGIDRKYFI